MMKIVKDYSGGQYEEHSVRGVNNKCCNVGDWPLIQEGKINGGSCQVNNEEAEGF